MKIFPQKLLLLLMLSLLIGGISHAQEMTRGNSLAVFSSTSSFQELSDTQPYPFHQFLTLGAIRAYQLLISPSKGTSCPMHPHCSLYGYQAFKQYNPIKAFLMTADRLHRCGHDLNNYEAIEVADLVRFFDPVCPSTSYNDSKIPDQISLSTSTNSNAPGDNLGEDTSLFHFAEMLQAEGNFDRAVIEYRRLLSYFPDSHYRDQSLQSVFYCYYKAEQYLTAIHWGQNLLEKPMASMDKDELKFLIGASYLKSATIRVPETTLRK